MRTGEGPMQTEHEQSCKEGRKDKSEQWEKNCFGLRENSYY